jgi:hypothetical protein
MIVLIIVASVLLASISDIQFKNEAKDHQERLERKENAVENILTTSFYNDLSVNDWKLRFNFQG